MKIDKTKEFIDNFWLNLGDVTEIQTRNVFLDDPDLWRANPSLYIVKMMSKPENFSFTCKHLFNINLLPFQLTILKELWERPFPMFIASRGLGKTWTLAVYSLLKAIFSPGAKVVIAGAAFRQSKYVFEYCESIFNNSPMLRDILSFSRSNRPTRDIDRCVFRIGTSRISALPIGTGAKVRGERATDLILEEFASVNPEICEQVLTGFASVSAAPDQNVKSIGRINALKQLGVLNAEELEAERAKIKSNKIIVCGTPDFAFGHFARYWKRYRDIIKSKGDKEKLELALQGPIPEGFNYKDYSVLRIPYDQIPPGFMDAKTVGRAKATMHKSMFDMEYKCIFVEDTEGFFRRSLIEQSTCRPGSNLYFPSCGNVDFEAALQGHPARKYVMGIDPASEKDNFSIVILEIWPDHRRIVYSWTTTRSRQKYQVKMGATDEHDFFRYCARKIRNLNKIFPCEYIAMDMGGGGINIQEALADYKTLAAGELPIFPVKNDDDPLWSDALPGLHLIERIQFSKADWVSEANHGLKKDLEDHILIFPSFNNVLIAIALEKDKHEGRVKADLENDLIDTLEDCMLEIEDLKYELTTIVHTKTLNGRERWDTPEIKVEGTSKKGRMVKDRYSALLMANKVARDSYIESNIPKTEYKYVGGIAQELVQTKRNKTTELYYGPDWFVQKIRENQGYYGTSVKRK